MGVGIQQIRLSYGLFALCSEDDYEWLMQWKWTASHESRGTKWYAIRHEKIDGKRVKIRMHREVISHMYPETYQELLVPGAVVDHINHNSLDNTRSNLRVVTQRENMLASPGWKRKP